MSGQKGKVHLAKCKHPLQLSLTLGHYFVVHEKQLATWEEEVEDGGYLLSLQHHLREGGRESEGWREGGREGE